MECIFFIFGVQHDHIFMIQKFALFTFSSLYETTGIPAGFSGGAEEACTAPMGISFEAFQSENGYRLSLFGLELGMVFEETTGMCESICLQMN